MARLVRKILTDLRHLRHVDLYAAALVAFVFAVLGLVNDLLPDGVRWSVLFAALGILVLRSAVSVGPGVPREERFLDRTDYARHPIADALTAAKEVWIFAPTAANFLTAERCEVLRRGPLSRADGVVRVVVLAEADPQGLVARHLDALLDFPVQEAAQALRDIRSRLERMASWQVQGTFGYGTLPFNPGFSIVAVNPRSADGFATVEFHAFRNETISERMHIRLTRADAHWYQYWLGQFDAMWQAADRPGGPTP